MPHPWTIEYSGQRFESFVRKLPEHEQAVLIAAIEQVLVVEGIAICESEWGKALGKGLYEFRVRKTLRRDSPTERDRAAQRSRPVLLRVFCAFHGDRVVLLLGGYDKKRDPSAKRQTREIRAARRELVAWRSGQTRR